MMAESRTGPMTFSKTWPIAFAASHRCDLINVAICAVVFTMDWLTPMGVSTDILYTIVILNARRSPNLMAIYRWAGITTLLSVGGLIISEPALNWQWNLVDRTLTIVCLWVVANLSKAREEALRQRNRAIEVEQAKGRFLAAASHDLRQPVQALKLLASSLLRRLKNDPARGVADALVGQVDALGTLLTSFLDLSRLESGLERPKLCSFHIGALIDRLGQNYAAKAESKGLKLRIVAPNLVLVSDPVLVERVLRNLIENAINHSERGGILIGCRRSSDHIRLDVIDTGRGIPANKLTHIFQEFQQLGNAERSPENGFGLGLSIVKRSADLLGQKVEITSSEGRGSRFSLFLPGSES
jgi:signal transduction histidine kinase